MATEKTTYVEKQDACNDKVDTMGCAVISAAMCVLGYMSARNAVIHANSDLYIESVNKDVNVFFDAATAAVLFGCAGAGTYIGTKSMD